MPFFEHSSTCGGARAAGVRPNPQSKENLWPFSSVAPKYSGKHSSMSVAQASKAAFIAGKKSGDTGQFQSWLESKGLDGRSRPVIDRLKREYGRGFESNFTSGARAVESPSMRSSIPQKAKGVTYRGYQIKTTDDGEYVIPRIDADSHFDTLQDAKRFLDDWRKNPSTLGTRNPSDRANMTFDRESGDYIVFGVAVPGGAQHFPTVGKAEAAVRRYGGAAIRTKSRRKNPEEAEGDLYEAFHGKPATSTIFVNEEFAEVRDLETLGILVNFWVATIRDPRKGTLIETSDAEGDFDEVGADEDTVFLAANRSGTQLYFVGGDQSLDLDKLKFTGDWVKPAMIIGVMYELTYRTRKKFDKFELTDYYHGLGEETGDQPTLMYDSLSPHCAVVGGKYKIKVPLVGMSPGIEN